MAEVEKRQSHLIGESECESVRKLFQTAWPTRKPPDLQLCYRMATAIDVVRSRRPRVNQDTKRRGSLLGATGEKYARLFVRHSEIAQRKFEEDLKERMRVVEVATCPQLQDWVRRTFAFDRDKSLLDEMSKVQGQVAALLGDCETKAVRPNPARFLADTLQATWRDCRDDKPPRSVNPDDPLCRFVHAALAEAGVKYGQPTVSDMLRGRAGRRRSGKKRPDRAV